jgi:hypothetical protein
MDIPKASLSQLGQVLRRAAIETRYQATRPLERAAAAASAEDRLEISEGGREASRLRALLLARARGMDGLREGLVAQARQRVASGFYDAEGVVGQISDRMLSQTTLGSLQAGGPADEAAGTEYRSELMREVGDKIQGGFYSDQDVMRFVADRLLDIYQIPPQDGEQ